MPCLERTDGWLAGARSVHVLFPASRAHVLSVKAPKTPSKPPNIIVRPAARSSAARRPPARRDIVGLVFARLRAFRAGPPGWKGIQSIESRALPGTITK